MVRQPKLTKHEMTSWTLDDDPQTGGKKLRLWGKRKRGEPFLPLCEMNFSPGEEIPSLDAFLKTYEHLGSD